VNPPPEPQDSLLDSESVHLDLSYRYFASPLRPKEVEHAMLLQYLHSINRDAGQSGQLTPVVHNMMFLGSTDHQVVVRWDSPVSSGHGRWRPGGTYCGAGVLDASPFRTPLRVAQHWPRPGIDSTRAPATHSAEGLIHGHERPGRAQGRSNHVG